MQSLPRRACLTSISVYSPARGIDRDRLMRVTPATKTISPQTIREGDSGTTLAADKAKPDSNVTVSPDAASELPSGNVILLREIKPVSPA